MGPMLNEILPYVIGEEPKSRNDKVTVRCAICAKAREVFARSAIVTIKKHGKIVCTECGVYVARSARWEQFLAVVKPYIIGPLPSKCKDRVTTKCSKCAKQYSVSALYIERNIKVNGSVLCNHCSIKICNDEWKNVLRPFVPNIDAINDQKQEVQSVCTKCGTTRRVIALSLLRSIKEKKRFGWCSACVNADPILRERRSKSQKGRPGRPHTPDERAHLSRVLKEKWRSPEVRANYCAGIGIPVVELQRMAQEAGYQHLSKEGDDHRLRCLTCGTEVLRRPHNFHKGCIECLGTSTSRAEQEIKEYVRALGFKAEKTKILGLEVDVYVESVRIGIEYCGLYWHAESNRPNTHIYQKYMNLRDTIRLLTVFEDEWLHQKEKVKKVIKYKLLSQTSRLYGRDCDVLPISGRIASEFTGIHHLNGAKNSNVLNMGLFYRESLVAVMCFGWHHRNPQEFVLSRFCTNGMAVVGGASKLFAAALGEIRNLGVKKVTTWSDNRWSTGDLYKRLGFVLDAELPADYHYVKGNKRYSKQSLKKTPEERLTGKTEFELRTEQGYDRIWDCGKKRWVFTL